MFPGGNGTRPWNPRILLKIPTIPNESINAFRWTRSLSHFHGETQRKWRTGDTGNPSRSSNNLVMGTLCHLHHPRLSRFTQTELHFHLARQPLGEIPFANICISRGSVFGSVSKAGLFKQGSQPPRNRNRADGCESSENTWRG